MGKKIVYLGTFGVLSTVCLTLFVVLNFFVNQPLKKVIKATKGIADGEFRKLDFNRNDEIGQVVYAFNAMVDSLNRQAKEVTNLIGALSESEQRYRILFESAVEGILVTEIKTKKFKYANPALCKILGYSEKEFAQMTLFDIHPKDKLEFAVSQFETMAQGGKILTSDVAYCRKDGTIIYADIKGTKILVDQTECILGHFTDITSRKLAEDENKKLQIRLQRAEKMEALGVLAGGVAHDLNNVLCGLVSYPEFLLLDLPEDSPLRDPILTIESSGKKAAAIVQDLLTLARRGVAVTEVTNLNDVISEYLGSLEFEKLIKFHPSTEIDIDLNEDLFNITGSPVHLSKTVMNLVSNATEAIPEELGEGRVADPVRGAEGPDLGLEPLLQQEHHRRPAPGRGVEDDPPRRRRPAGRLRDLQRFPRPAGAQERARAAPGPPVVRRRSASRLVSVHHRPQGSASSPASRALPGLGPCRRLFGVQRTISLGQCTRGRLLGPHPTQVRRCVSVRELGHRRGGHQADCRAPRERNPGHDLQRLQ